MPEEEQHAVAEHDNSSAVELAEAQPGVTAADPADGQRAAALLVIHGIGEQRPYQTLDAFARGLARSLAIEPRQIEHRLTWHQGQSLSSLRLPTVDTHDGLGAQHVDLIEFYWAGQVQGQIRLRRVLRWLAKTSLTPLLSWSKHPQVLFREQYAAARPLFIFVRELARAGFLIVLAALIVLPFVFAAANGDVVADAAQSVWATLRSVQRPVLLVGWAVLVFFALMILRGWVQLGGRRVARMTRRSDNASTEKKASAWWLRASAAGFSFLAGSAAVIYVRFDLGVAGLVVQLWISVSDWPVLLPLVAALLAALLRYPLLKFVGDITLYVTADQRSSFYRTRNEILKGSTELLRSLLKDSAYDAVYVAGHSLGSVIAYDTINRLATEVRAASTDPSKLGEAELNTLKGLLTFGSPLDKIYYFFRTEVKDEEAIRAQVLSSLHGFRRGPSGRDYGTLALARYQIPEPQGFRWYNVYSPSDPVSAFLDFYRVDKQVRRRYWPPLLAHMAYWNDHGFYDVVREWLSTETSAEPVPKE